MNTDNTEVLEYWKERAIRFEEKFDAVNGEVLYLQSRLSSTPAGEDVEKTAEDIYCKHYARYMNKGLKHKNQKIKPKNVVIADHTRRAIKEICKTIAGYKAALQNKVPVIPQNNMKYIKASIQIPPVGIYNALYNGDHVIFQVHDGGFRVINYHGEKDDQPKLSLIKWLDESVMENKVPVEKKAPQQKFYTGYDGVDYPEID